MGELIYNLIFLLLTIFILLRTIGYAFYEIKTLNNKVSGIIIIVLSTLVVIFANVMIWLY